MAGVPETLRKGSCLPQHVNLPYMQEGEREGIFEGDLGGGAAAGPVERPGSAAASGPCDLPTRGAAAAGLLPSPSLTVPQPSTLRLTPLLCKEGRGEVECWLFYPTQPPLTKGRRQLRVRVSSPFMNNPG